MKKILIAGVSLIVMLVSAAVFSAWDPNDVKGLDE
jgi:hypothetical protein